MYISAAVNVGLAAPLFSYQAMVLSPQDAERISKSPSLSMSATKTEYIPSTSFEFVIAILLHVGSSEPSCSNQLRLLLLKSGEIMSISPSLSISAAKTEYAIVD